MKRIDFFRLSLKEKNEKQNLKLKKRVQKDIL